ncbi:MAG: sigma-54 dependent transcriptional regulator [Polyangiales bacterium]
MPRFLVVDPDEDARAFITAALRGAGHEVTAVSRAGELPAALGPYAAAVTAEGARETDGPLRRLRALAPALPVVCMVAPGDVAAAAEAVRGGAVDVFELPFGNPARLRLAAERAAALRGADDGAATLSWGAPAMVPVVDALRKVAGTDTTVFLQGESGVGKEVAARALHAWSRRAAAPFVAINCASLSETLLESELFGHEKGAFTGAVAARVGRVEAAAGGTFFLDEVGEIATALQARLLRLLQEKEFTRVGGTKTQRADVRWIAATNRDLRRAVREGRFREDLYHRLMVFPVKIPALRERRDDIAPLADALLARLRAALGRPGLRLSDGARRSLAQRAWPGNVRELGNALERAAILTEGDVIESIPSSESLTRSLDLDASVPTLEQAELAVIRKALARNEGNRKRAAEQLGIGLRTLYDKLKRYKLE